MASPGDRRKIIKFSSYKFSSFFKGIAMPGDRRKIIKFSSYKFSSCLKEVASPGDSRTETGGRKSLDGD